MLRRLEKTSFIRFHKLTYEMFKGLHLSLLFQGSLQNDISNKTYGLEAQWFPRPHYEISTSFQFVDIPSIKPYGIMTVMTHFYL